MRLYQMLGLVSLAFATSVASVSAHPLATATGHAVSHLDAASITSCAQTRCPISDSSFESQVGFRSADRVYPNNFHWNCHGRTFDARRSWTSYADAWVTYDRPYCPVSPQSGQAVIWWENGKTSHTVTIVGPWRGLDTIVMSKYGTQGQYKHALRNAIALYKANWAVTAFGAGTQIYSTSTSQALEAPTVASAVEGLWAQRERMPWYKDVLASQVLADVEHARLVARAGSLREVARLRISRAGGDEKLVEALLDDLRDSSHYGLLGAYNSPEFTEDFISAIESGKLLVSLGSDRPHLRLRILDGLLDLASDTSAQDYARGSAVHLLSKIMSNDERNAAREELLLHVKEAEARSGLPPTYLDHYLGKL